MCVDREKREKRENITIYFWRLFVVGLRIIS